MYRCGIVWFDFVFAEYYIRVDSHLFTLVAQKIWLSVYPPRNGVNKRVNISPKRPSFLPENARRKGRRTKTKRPIIIDYQSFALYPLRGLRGTNLINWIVVIYLYTYFFGYVFSYENRERTYLFVLSGRWPFNGNFYRYKDNKSYWKKLIFW